MRTRTVVLTTAALALLLVAAPLTAAKGPPADRGHQAQGQPADDKGGQSTPSQHQASQAGASNDQDSPGAARGPSEDRGPPEHAGDPQGPAEGDRPASSKGRSDQAHEQAPGQTRSKAQDPAPEDPDDEEPQDGSEASEEPASAPEEADPEPAPAPEPEPEPAPEETLAPLDPVAEEPTEASDLDPVIEPTEPVPDPDAQATEPPVTEAAGSQGAGDEHGEPATGFSSTRLGQALVPAALTQPAAEPESRSGQPAATGTSSKPGLWGTPALVMLGLTALAGAAYARRHEPGADQPAEAPAPPEPPLEALELPAEVEPSLSGFMEQGHAALDQGDPASAIDWFRAAVALDPQASGARLSLGVTLAHSGRLPEALETIEAAVQLEPGDPLTRFHLARVLAQMGLGPDALDELERVVPQMPYMVEQVHQDPAFASLQDHPRFLAMLGKL